MGRPVLVMGEMEVWNKPRVKIYKLKGHPYTTVMEEGIDLLKRLKIFCWLSSGTLLGIYRDGKLMEDDADIDVGVFGSDFTDDIEVSFAKHGFELIRAADKRGPHQRAFQKDGVVFDIMFWYKDDEGFYFNYVDWGTVCKPVHLLENFENIQYEGKTYKCPSPEAYCAWRYGKDWKVPKKGFKGKYNEAMATKAGDNKWKE